MNNLKNIYDIEFKGNFDNKIDDYKSMLDLLKIVKYSINLPTLMRNFLMKNQIEKAVNEYKNNI